MAGTKLPSQVDPRFFAERAPGLNWVTRIRTKDGAVQEFEGVDVEMRSRFGSVRDVVAMGRDGRPAFDRPEYREAPNVNVVAYGFRGGQVHVGILHEGRPHADDPTNPASTETMVFGQVPMGFLEKLLGRDAPLEAAREAAVREVGEETGATAVIEVTQPSYPYQNPNPTFVATWSELFFVKVNLDRIEALRTTREEQVYKAQYISNVELRRRIVVGTHEGAVYRACTSNALFFIFFCHFPQYF